MATKPTVLKCSDCGVEQLSLKCSHGCCACCCPSTGGNIQKQPCQHTGHRPTCPNCLNTISLKRVGNGVISCKSCCKTFTLVPKLEDKVFNKHRIEEINCDFKREEYRNAERSRNRIIELHLQKCEEFKDEINGISAQQRDTQDRHRKELEEFTRELKTRQRKEMEYLEMKFEEVHQERNKGFEECEHIRREEDEKILAYTNLRKMARLSNLLKDQGHVDIHCIHCIEDADNQLREYSPIDICNFCKINVCVNHLHLHEDCKLSFEPLVELLVEYLPNEIANIVYQYT
jgi:ribosomal protein L37AE/L43A